MGKVGGSKTPQKMGILIYNIIIMLGNSYSAPQILYCPYFYALAGAGFRAYF